MLPILKGRTILVRPHKPGDLGPLFAAVRESIPEISPWLPWCHPAFAADELAGFIEASRSGWSEKSQYQFAIFDATNGLALGGISLTHLVKANRLANMGYWVRTSATRRGVASEAVKLVAAYGFRQLGLGRIEIAALPQNIASRRVAERAGAQYEGVVRNRLVMHGTSHNAALYSLIPGDLDVDQAIR